MKTIEDMISQEVRYCVSLLVHDVAKDSEDYLDLFQTEPDYAECGKQNGYLGPLKDREGETFFKFGDAEDDKVYAEDWQELCDLESLDAYDYCPEVFEHWLVTDWFGRKLQEYGETVTMDWHGLTIWSRTTTGQAIKCDGVINRIYKDMTVE